MKVNKTLISLENIYDKLTISQIWVMIGTLKDIVSDLEGDKIYHLENPYNGLDIAKEIQSINTQLQYSRLNIKTLETALTDYEKEVSTQFFNVAHFEPIYWN